MSSASSRRRRAHVPKNPFFVTERLFTKKGVASCYHLQLDLSNGYESVSGEFLARHGNGRTRSNAICVKEVREWAKTLPRRSSVIDLGCEPGLPITVVLVEKGLHCSIPTERARHTHPLRIRPPISCRVAVCYSATAKPLVWTDAVTGLESISLGPRSTGSCSEPQAYRSQTNTRMSAKTTTSTPSRENRQGSHSPELGHCLAIG